MFIINESDKIENHAEIKKSIKFNPKLKDTLDMRTSRLYEQNPTFILTFMKSKYSEEKLRFIIKEI